MSKRRKEVEEEVKPPHLEGAIYLELIGKEVYFTFEFKKGGALSYPVRSRGADARQFLKVLEDAALGNDVELAPYVKRKRDA